MRRSDIALLREWARRVRGPAPGVPVRHRALSDVELRWGRPRGLPPGVARRSVLGLAEVGAVIMALRDDDGVWGHVVVPGRVARALARHVLGTPPELDAPRATTWIERGVVAFTACALGDAGGCSDLTIELVERPRGAADVADRSRARVPLVLELPGAEYRAVLAISRPSDLAPPVARSLDELLSRRGARLAGIQVDIPIVMTLGTLSRSAGHALRRRDVMVSPLPDNIFLAPGGDRIPVRLDRERDRVMVCSRRTRGRAMARMPPDAVPVTDPTARSPTARSPAERERAVTGDSLALDVTCRLGHATMSARDILELEPGQVIPLRCPLGGPVDILCGDQLLGSGALVDVDGELGVQILALADEVSPAPASRGPRATDDAE